MYFKECENYNKLQVFYEETVTDENFDKKI